MTPCLFTLVVPRLRDGSRTFLVPKGILRVTVTVFFPLEALGVARVDAAGEEEAAGLDIGETAAEGEGSALQAFRVSRPLTARAIKVKCRIGPPLGTEACCPLTGPVKRVARLRPPFRRI